jgi:hypothetical protein
LLSRRISHEGCKRSAYDSARIDRSLAAGEQQIARGTERMQAPQEALQKLVDGRLGGAVPRVLGECIDHRHQILEPMPQFADDEIASFARKPLLVDVVERADPFVCRPIVVAHGHRAHAVPAPRSVIGFQTQFDALRFGVVRLRPVYAILRVNGFEPVLHRIGCPALRR